MSRAVVVRSARDLGPQFVENPHRMVGQDGAFSFPLPDGGSFWFFGDTLIGRRPPTGSPWIVNGKLVDHRDMTGLGDYERMINNTGLVLPPTGGADGLRGFRYLLDTRGGLRNLIPHEAGEDPDWDRMWCQHGAVLGDGRVVLSFIQVLMTTGNPGPLPIGFKIVGSGLSISRGAPGPGRWTELAPFQRVRHDGSHVLWGAEAPHFGTAFLAVPGDAFLYVYGTVSRVGRQRAYLARVRPERIDQLPAYEYLSAPGPAAAWSARLDDAVELFCDMPSEVSVSFNPHLGAYLAVHSIPLSGQIVARTAPAPWGPWSDAVTLFGVTPPPLPYARPYPTPLIYAGKEHASLSPDGGRTIYLTYIEFEEYFPHLIEVVLA